jgi:hypothetical protein
MRKDRFPLCPLPGLGHCVRERCNFWDEAREECTADCFDAYEPAQGLSGVDPASPCTIYWTEDCD